MVFIYYRGNRHLDPVASDPIWTLLHVCQRWRDVAQDQSSLWCRIEANALSNTVLKGHPEESRIALTCTVLGRYLANSHNHPLDICIGDFQEVCWRPVIELIWDHHPRWRHVDVAFSGIELLAEVARASLPLGVSQVPMPLFKCLRIESFVVDLPCLAPVLSASGLRHLELDTSVTGALAHVLPWSQITRYRGAAYADGGQFLLSYMPNLEICEVLADQHPGDNLRTSSQLESPVCPMSRLRVLSLEGLAGLCLRSIEAPSLEKLRINVYDHSHLLAYVKRSGLATLSTLSTECGVDGMGDHRLREILLSCPALRVLALHCEGAPPTDIFALLAEDASKILPRLAVLHIVPWPYTVQCNPGQVETEAYFRRLLHVAKCLLAQEDRSLRSVEMSVITQHSSVPDVVRRVAKDVLGDHVYVLTLSGWRGRHSVKKHFQEFPSD
ncbi:uncharacterized protein SCHCODRAFT_01182790 [Schizophyllum commune H4-8]|nr:uncharacterized protein SCHCODRAFT_01182790 [Schizophyllum commune H4-8]KAI5888533.1 hypothetical protein SCHCODRAFT_01182790 [Schizophyllum commune H4-8]